MTMPVFLMCCVAAYLLVGAIIGCATMVAVPVDNFGEALITVAIFSIFWLPVILRWGN